MIAIADLRVLACDIYVGRELIVAMTSTRMVEIEMLEDEDAPREAPEE